MAKRKKRASAALEEAELILGLPDLRDSVDADDLPINFILKRGRDRAAAKTRQSSQAPATKRRVKKKNKK